MPLPVLGMIGAGLVSGAANAAGGAMMGQVFAGMNDRRQIRQQRKLQALQLEGNKQMMDWQQQKEMEMWRSTSYGAQKEQMEKAGLNPALMYGMSGGGGTTTGGGSGQVSGGNAPVGGGEIMMGLQLATQQAQIKLMEAQAVKTEAEAQKIQGVDTELTRTQTESLTQGISNQRAVETLTKVQSNLAKLDEQIKGDTVESVIKQIKWASELMRQQLDMAATEAQLNREQREDKVKLLKAQIVSIGLGQLLTGAQIQNTNTDTKLKAEQILKTDQDRRAVAQQIMMGWEALSVQQKLARIKEMTGAEETPASNIMRLIDNIF